MKKECKKQLKIGNLKSYPQSEKHAEKLTNKIQNFGKCENPQNLFMCGCFLGSLMKCDYACECDYNCECDYECGCEYECECDYESECECEGDYEFECEYGRDYECDDEMWLWM